MWPLAVRNVLRQAPRYRLLLILLVIGFALMVTTVGLTNGMTQSLERKAARYFSGDLTITGYSRTDREAIDDEAKVLGAIEASQVPFAGLCRRTNYNTLDASVFFNGTSVRQRRLVGIDWTVEASNFSDMDFVSGGIQAMPGSDGILVSSQVATKTGLRTGDELILLLTTRGGAQNTATLVVKGVYRETSIFGSTAYLDIETLNRLWGLKPGSSTDMGLVLTPGASPEWASEVVRKALVATGLQVFGAINTREDQNNALNEPWSGRKYAVMSLRAHLSLISDVLDALRLISVVVLVFIFGVVIVGVSNTYQMILRERVREIGTLRALGMQASSVNRLFLAEATLLASIGVAGGLILGTFFLTACSLLNLSVYSLLLMFLKQGRPDWWLDPWWTFFASAMMFTACWLGVAGSARRASKLAPVEALNDKD